MSNRASRLKKMLQGYDPFPPRCETCLYYRAPQHKDEAIVIDGVEIAPALKYIHSTCVFQVKKCDSNSFAVDKNAVCDEWVHKTTNEIIDKDAL